MTWHDMTWHDMTWHDMTWHDMTWHEISIISTLSLHFFTLCTAHQSSKALVKFLAKPHFTSPNLTFKHFQYIFSSPKLQHFCEVLQRHWWLRHWLRLLLPRQRLPELHQPEDQESECRWFLSWRLPDSSQGCDQWNSGRNPVHTGYWILWQRLLGQSLCRVQDISHWPQGQTNHQSKFNFCCSR